MIFDNRTMGVGVLAGLVLGVSGANVEGAQTAHDAQLVNAYAETCLPERFSFDGTLAHAKKLGWADTNLHLHTELNTLLLKSREEMMADAEDGFDFDARIAALWRPVGATTLHFVVTEILSEYIDLVGCYIYDFSAQEIVDAELVTALLNHPVSYRTDGDDPDYQMPQTDLVSVVWGPPSDYPRMFDTYLTFVPADSPYAQDLGFTGLVLKSETSLPDRASR